MKRSIPLLITFLSLAQCSRPYLNNPITKRQTKKDEENHNCIKTTKYTAVERMQFYPFDRSAVIKIVSFDNLKGSYVEHTLPMKGKEIDYTKITEERTLTKEQIDELTSILYNVTYKGKIDTEDITACYNPRNAILFCDKNNNLLDYIELCFECSRSRMSSEKISLGDVCDQKWDLLKTFFSTAGIEIGTIKEVMER